VSEVVGVVVVNYNGGTMTLECLRSVLASDWPADELRVVLVDNASSDGIATRVRAEMPAVEVVESRVNGGFGAGCNLGIRALEGSEYVALVNNDATVTENWLPPLVQAMRLDPRVGAACPKILFSGRFAEIELHARTTRHGRGDMRDLGVMLSGARVEDHDVWPRTQLVDGFWGFESGRGSQWSTGLAHLRVPVVGDVVRGACSFLLSADQSVPLVLRSGAHSAEYVVGTSQRWFDVQLGGTPIDVINNVGSELTRGGFGVDRGYLEPDDGRFDAPTDVFAWCGAAVLLRREYLDDVGPFDERLFLYYEDLELSWRGAKRGWQYRYVPTSIVRHMHSATSGDGSTLKRYYDERNHLIVLARHAPARQTALAAARSLLVTASYARRDLIAPALARRPLSARLVKDRLAAFGGFVKLLPGTVRTRGMQASARE
jgi:GT2 family glycosyltransferase